MTGHPTSESAAIPTATVAQTDQYTVLPGQTPEGAYILGVLFKRSYDLISGKRCIRAALDKKLFAGDVYFGDPMNSTIEFETDFTPFKVATDVVLNGRAYAPGGKPATSFVASLFIGQTRKDVAIIGDRVCRHRRLGDPEFTTPQPFMTMDLRYEKAYGGVDIYSDTALPCAYPRNYLGCGYAVGKGKKIIDNLKLPNLEDPRNLLTPLNLSVGEFKDWAKQPMPQNFGWFAKFWYPRATLAGIMPADQQYADQMREAYASALPPAERELYNQAQLGPMDFRFFNGASPGLALPFLAGAETIRAVNLSVEGDFSFQLPGEQPVITTDFGQGECKPDVVLHTVMIRMEDKQVDLVWRGAVPYPGPEWLPEMTKAEVQIQ